MLSEIFKTPSAPSPEMHNNQSDPKEIPYVDLLNLEEPFNSLYGIYSIFVDLEM